MGAMFPASLFNAQAKYLHVAGWITAGRESMKAPGRDGVAPLGSFARVMLHRAFRVMEHLARAESHAAAAADRLSKVELAPDESLDGVLVWSAEVETATVALIAAIADLHVLQNDTVALIARASFDGPRLPESLRDARAAIERDRAAAGKAPQWLAAMPRDERDLIRGYWTSHGERLSAYRNLDQHSGVLGRSATVRTGPSGARVVLRLPDNPEDRNRREHERRKPLTFTRETDGIALARETLERLHALAETFARGRGATPGQHVYTIDMVPVRELDVASGQLLHVMLDGETTWLTRSIPDEQLRGSRIALQRIVRP